MVAGKSLGRARKDREQEGEETGRIRKRLVKPT